MKRHRRTDFTSPDDAGRWMACEGPDRDVVVTSRIRLARNVKGFAFKARLSSEKCQELEDLLKGQLSSHPFSKDQVYLSLDQVEPLDRELLLERHLISPELARGTGPRGVCYSRERHLSIMINEEDHLRMQMLAPGSTLDSLMEQITHVDQGLGRMVEFAMHPRFGYLTSCPTNVGSGLRLSVMLHLPALVYSKEIEKEFNAANKMKLAVRGFYGEGTSFLGDFFQVSNQVTLGKNAEVLLSDLKKVIPQIVEHELDVRRLVHKQHRLDLEDRIFRAYGILRNSRRISSQEALELLSRVRLGVTLGLIPRVDLKTINELLVMSQPAHVQAMEQHTLSEEERDSARARYLRRRLGGDDAGSPEERGDTPTQQP